MANSIANRLLAVSLLAVLWPILLILYFLVEWQLGAPAIFIQERAGLQGKRFRLLKFRSMTDEQDENGVLKPDAERLTAFGRFLRSTSLDELPEIINILRGEMNFVGPRPLLPDYLPLYNARQARRHEVKPGLTGWAQINGRNALSWQDRLEFDVWYVEHRSLLLDIKIVWKTLFKVVLRDGINGAGSATMERFRGDDR